MMRNKGSKCSNGSSLTKSDLGNAGWTKPVSLWHLGDFRPQAVHVAATITAITQQQAIIIVSLPTNLTSLNKKKCMLLI